MKTATWPTPGIAARLRRTVEVSVAAAIVLLALRTWALEGLLVSVRVASGSMAPAMLGPHFRVTCSDCGHPFTVDATRPLRRLLTCVNCGHNRAASDGAWLAAGERILIDRNWQVRPPRRWEPIVYRCPQDGKTYCVKRVVGLPGEMIQIVDGDVYIDGQIARKPLVRLREMRILVHDARHASTLAALPPRWQSDSQRWQLDGGRFAHDAAAAGQSAPRAELAWLEYRHWLPLRSDPKQVQPAPIYDDHDHNQHDPGGAHRVGDVMLSARVRLEQASESSGTLGIRASDGVDLLEFASHYDFYGEPAGISAWSLAHNQAQVRQSRRVVGGLPVGRWFTLEVSLCDQQLVVAIDGRPMVEYPYVAASPRNRGTDRPLAIGAAGLKVELTDVAVYRDVYYVPPRAAAAPRDISQPLAIPPQSYYVLGDNSPISDDSRDWASPGLPRRWIVGRPIRWPW
jgi:signal peptidase I